MSGCSSGSGRARSSTGSAWLSGRGRRSDKENAMFRFTPRSDGQGRTRPHAPARSGTRFACEPLEARVLLSTIAWANRGEASDGFDATFGTNAAAARAVVDAGIDAWEQVIASFN